MRINNLELTDFRNYNHFFIEFDQGINILIGGNAQGKTNIIEAIYLLSVCKSFRTHINDQMIQFDHDFAKVKGNVFSNERMHQLELILSKESKKAKVDGKDILNFSTSFFVMLGSFLLLAATFLQLSFLKFKKFSRKFGLISLTGIKATRA